MTCYQRQKDFAFLLFVLCLFISLHSDAQWYHAKANHSTPLFDAPHSKANVIKKVKEGDRFLVLLLNKEAKYINVWDIESNTKGFGRSIYFDTLSLLQKENLVEGIHSSHANHKHTNLYIENSTIDSLSLQLGDSIYKLAPNETKVIEELPEGDYPYWAVQKESYPDYGFIFIPDSSDLKLKIGQEFNQDKLLEMELFLKPLKEEEEYDMYKVVNIDTVRISKPPSVGESKSGYENIQITTGTKSVDADLFNDDIKKDAWINVKPMDKPLDHFYDFKRYLNLKYNLAIGMDYMLLGQKATYVQQGTSSAASGIYRFFGTWEPLNTKITQGSLIFKIENRHSFTTTAPRHLGYESGSALSTASFKDMGWGLTNLYWRQTFYHNKIGYVFGIMDPGDFIDLFPLLNPYKYFLNEAFFNNPAMAIPNQGIGAAFLFKDFIPNTYIAGGFHDANGEPTYLIKNSIESFSRGEYLYWVELGINTDTPFLDGENIHVTYWYQNERTASSGEQIAEQSQGVCFSASKAFNKKSKGFFRAAISEGEGALMRYMVMGGYMYNLTKSDNIGIGIDMGEPSDPEVNESQIGVELFYNLQLTEHLNFTPDIQMTINPVYNPQKDAVAIFSLRMRYAL